MEPFGLFNLLKSAVFPENKTEVPPTQPEASAADTDAAEPTPPFREAQDTPNAFVDFMAAHDARAKRLKKRP